MRYVATILTILLLLFAPSVSAAGNVRQYNVGYLNMGLGMPSNYVDDIYKDSYGSIWISTHGGGLVRYDGYSFFNLGLGGASDCCLTAAVMSSRTSRDGCG